MKRRKLLQSVLAAPALAAMPAPAPAQTPSYSNKDAVAGSPDNFKIPLTAPDLVAQPGQHFFTPDQFAALERLGDILVPKLADRPGSREANAAKFIEFLISQSPQDRQSLYRDGLDRLNAEARKLHQKPFAEVSPVQAGPILKPLEAAWTYAGPSDPFAQFLQAAKEDVLRATLNSHAYSTAMAATTRGSSGLNYYWLPVE
jgi:hypothetical protein